MMSKEKKHPEATCGALIFNDKQEVFLMRSHKWNNKYALPGGHIEYGERVEEAVKREVKEETNLDVEIIEFFMMQDCIFPDEFYKKERHFIFIDFLCRATNSVVKLNDEAESYVWVKVEDALKLPVESYTVNLLKKYSFNEFGRLFNGLMKKDEDFVDFLYFSKYLYE